MSIEKEKYVVFCRFSPQYHLTPSHVGRNFDFLSSREILVAGHLTLRQCRIAMNWEHFRQLVATCWMSIVLSTRYGPSFSRKLGKKGEHLEVKTPVLKSMRGNKRGDQIRTSGFEIAKERFAIAPVTCNDLPINLRPRAKRYGCG